MDNLSKMADQELPRSENKGIQKTAVPNSGYIVQDAPPAIGKDYNDYLLAARRLISVER